MFIITSAITLCLGTSLFIKDCRIHMGHQSGPSLIRRHLIHHYSNYQLASGVAFQTFALISMPILSPYHFGMIWLFSLITTSTHNLTLLVLTASYNADRLLRWFRITLMFFNQVLNCAIAVIILRTKVSDLPATLPVACVGYYAPASLSDLHWSTYVPVTLTVTGNCLVFILAVWYMNMRARNSFWAMKSIGVALMWLISVSSMAEVVLNSQAFGTPPIPLRDLDERTWDPAQGLMFMSLGLPLITAMEIQRCKSKVTRLRRVADGPSLFFIFPPLSFRTFSVSFTSLCLIKFI